MQGIYLAGSGGNRSILPGEGMPEDDQQGCFCGTVHVCFWLHASALRPLVARLRQPAVQRWGELWSL